MPAPASSPARRRFALAALAGTLVVGLGTGLSTAPAYAEGTASTVVAEGNLGLDGVLKVKETITFAGSAPKQVTQKFETREDLVGDRQYVQTITDVSATATGTGGAAQVSSDDRFTTVSVSSAGATEVVVNYSVLGAVVNAPAGTTATALRFRMLQGLSVAVQDFTATVKIPTQYTYLKCTSGSPNSPEPCRAASDNNPEATQTPTFLDGPRGEGEVVAVEIGFPAGSLASNERIDRRWTLGRAFSAGPLPLAVALGALLLGALGLLFWHRRSGVDARSPEGAVGRVAEFVPVGPGQAEFRVVGDVRPGHVGTVADERVDPIDVTATLLDLAVRGHLLITELPRDRAYARGDWELTRRVGGDDLQPFEAALLDGVAPPGSAVRVSQLSDRVNASIGGVQDALYDDVVRRGWFERRPDATRNRWTQYALIALILAVAATAVLVGFTVFGLLGLALIAISLGLLFVAQEMPSRTAQGVELIRGLAALRSDLATQPTDFVGRAGAMIPGAALTEISELLPYAVVLGGADRWLDALAATDDDRVDDSTDLSWYHGPAGWQLGDLPDSLKNFVTTVSGTLFSRT